MRWAFLLLIALMVPRASTADVTIRNFDGLGTAATNQVSRIDVNGNKLLQGDEGTIIQWPGDPLFYLYGVDISTGAILGHVDAWGGFAVYTSPDLVQWTPAGAFDGTHMFDGTNSTWVTTCHGPTFASFCWNPHPVFSSGLNKYVLWATNTQQLFYTLCDTKVGPCGLPTVASGCGNPSLSNEGGNPFIDDNGTGYIVFTRIGSGTFQTLIQQLNTNYNDCVGSEVLVHSSTAEEGVSMFRRGSTYYILVGSPNCAYCIPGVQTQYYTATTPLGTWSAPTRIDTANTCGAQSAYVAKLTVGGTDNYIYTAWQWAGTTDGANNQSPSNQFWIPLTFTGTAINTFTCDATFTVVGLAPASGPQYPGTDQVNETAPSNNLCDIKGTTQRAQTFTAGIAAIPLSKIWIRPYQGNNECNNTSCANATGVNADLTVTLASVSAGAPASTLLTTTVSRTNFTWSPKRTQVTFPGSFTVVPGTQYAIVLSSPGATIGCWGIMYGNNTPYAGGTELVSSNGGSTWTPVTNTSLMFSTPGTSAVPGGIRGHGSRGR